MVGISGSRGGRFDIRVIVVIGVIAGDLDVLLIAVCPQAFISLFAIFLAQYVRVKGKIGSFLGIHWRSSC